jgi:hypothetical protein
MNTAIELAEKVPPYYSYLPFRAMYLIGVFCAINDPIFTRTQTLLLQPCHNQKNGAQNLMTLSGNV